MGLKITGYTFQGPFDSPADLKNESGVYVILTEDGSDWKLLDCGAASDIRHQVSNHPHEECWKKHAVGKIAFAGKYCEELGKKMIVKEIRQEHSLPCGDT
jgi:hypothetical protein